MKANYTPKTDNVFNKLMRKICNKNTPLNTTFTWFNKYKVTLQSGCRDFTAVYVTTLDGNFIADFDIDFAVTKLTIHSAYSEEFDDFTISDSLIKTFGDIYRASYITIDDTEDWKEEYDFYKGILSDREEYIPEYIEEAINNINLCDQRQEWIEEFSKL